MGTNKGKLKQQKAKKNASQENRRKQLNERHTEVEVVAHRPASDGELRRLAEQFGRKK